jgi:hypothetical protein
VNFPPILYKYRSVSDALRIFNEGRVKISSARAFNDPFELSPVFGGRIEASTLRALLLEPNAIRTLYDRNNPIMSLDAYMEFLHTNFDEIFQGINHDNIVAFAEKHFEDTTANDFPMFCMSAPPDDILMWAHYADCHSGVALGIDTEAWGTNPRAFLPVRYEDERPVINMNDITSKSDIARREAAFTNAFTTKSKHWTYEGEFRCFFPSTHPQISSLDKDGSKLLFWPFPPSRIKEIIFGCRCPPGSRASIANAASTAGCTDVRFRSACLDRRTFTILIEDIISG